MAQKQYTDKVALQNLWNSGLMIPKTTNYTVNGNAQTLVQAIENAGGRFVTSSTTKGVVAKTASCTGFSLYAGVKVWVKFTTTSGSKPSTNSAITLNINSTGAKNVYICNFDNNSTTQVMSDEFYDYFCNDKIYGFIYDGTNWVLLKSLIDSDVVKSISINDGTPINPDTNGNVNIDISGKEDVDNKVSAWSTTVNDTNYPSEKLVKDSLDNIDLDLKRKKNRPSGKVDTSAIEIHDIYVGDTSSNINPFVSPQIGQWVPIVRAFSSQQGQINVAGRFLLSFYRAGQTAPSNFPSLEFYFRFTAGELENVNLYLTDYTFNNKGDDSIAFNPAEDIVLVRIDKGTESSSASIQKNFQRYEYVLLVKYKFQYSKFIVYEDYRQIDADEHNGTDYFSRMIMWCTNMPLSLTSAQKAITWDKNIDTSTAPNPLSRTFTWWSNYMSRPDFRECFVNKTVDLSYFSTTYGASKITQIPCAWTDEVFTVTEKVKLAGIENGAEANVQSDWDETDATSDAYIKNKPTIETYTEGYGITIDENNDNAINAELEYEHIEEEWKPQDWNGVASFYGSWVWKDYDDVIHFDYGSAHFYLDSDNKTWIAMDWPEYTGLIYGSCIWKDNNGTIHFDYESYHYYLDSGTWRQQTWSGYTGSIFGYSIWKDYDGVIHYDNDSYHYYLDGTTWRQQTWSGYTNINYGDNIWTDNNGVIRYDRRSDHYYLDSNGTTWRQQTWGGYTSISGYFIWKDNNGVTHYDNGSDHYYLDGETWKQYTWNGYTDIDKTYIWKDNNGIIHYDYNQISYYLQEGKNQYLTAHGDELQIKLVAGDGITIIGDTIYAISKEVDISGKEDTNNKITAWCETPDDNHYPSEKLVKDSLTDLQNQITALMLGAKLALTVSPSVGIYGESVNYKFTATFSGATPDNIKIFNNSGTQVASTTSATSVATSNIPLNLTSNVKYTATAEYMGMTFNASVNTNIRRRILYGFTTETGHPTNKFNAVTTAKGQTFSDTSTIENAKFKIYVPIDVTKPTKFSMGGAPASYTEGTATVNGVSYATFTSDDVYGIDGHVDITAS